MKSVRTVWLEAQSLLVDSLKLEPSEARLEARLLLQTSLNVNRAWLLSHENDALGGNQEAHFEALIKRRLNGEPIAYILGKREFYGLEFIVTPDTLIPRPDTETLVEAALAKIPVNQACSVLDLGTGTGAIAIAIASERPRAQVTAVDASLAALAVAQANALNLNVKNVQFVLSDWFAELQSQTFDVIVSNPPYIAEDDPHLAQGNLRFEPTSALAAGEDGLDCIRVIVGLAKEHLKPQGWLMLEHGFDQAEKVAELMKNTGFDSITSAADLSGILRVTLCRLIP
jgi:release factor glutamine methyltransferase